MLPLTVPVPSPMPFAIGASSATLRVLAGWQHRRRSRLLRRSFPATSTSTPTSESSPPPPPPGRSSNSSRSRSTSSSRRLAGHARGTWFPARGAMLPRCAQWDWMYQYQGSKWQDKRRLFDRGSERRVKLQAHGWRREASRRDQPRRRRWEDRFPALVAWW